MTLLYIYRRKVIIFLILILGLLVFYANCFLKDIFHRPIHEALSIKKIKEIFYFPTEGLDKNLNQNTNIQRIKRYSVYNMSKLDLNDSTTLIDLDNFHFMLNSSPCKSYPNNPYLLIFIHTAPDHVEQRNVLRNTWAKKTDQVHPIFLIGQVDSDEIQKEITCERDKYDDIVQGNFHDSYHNLTYKHVMGLKWTTYYCQSATHILKTDDDSFVNMPYLLNFLPFAISSIDTKSKILCRLMDGSPLIRDNSSKWYVSESEFPGKCYPIYCSGYMILYSPEIIFKLYKESSKNKYFWVDDVYVSGVLAAKVNVTHYDTSNYRLSSDDIFALIKNNTPYKPFMYAYPNLSVDLLKGLWDIIVNFNKIDD